MFRLRMARTTIFGVAAAVMFWSDAMAQTVTDINPIDDLSPGNQKIAESLFDAQQAEDGDASWSLDEIAAAKQEGAGWGNVFKRMREENLVEAKNLGQLISKRGKRKPVFSPTVVDGIHTINANTARAASGRHRKLYRSDVVVTTANGGRVVVGLVKPGHRQRSFAKAKARPTAPGGARKVTVSSRNAFAARRISTGAGRARMANSSRPRGTRGRKAK